jgi:phosphoribosylamine---glycine ligase
VRILILGSGGREHAFAQALSKSPMVEELFTAPGNAGTAACGTNIPLSVGDFPAIRAFCRENSIDIVLPGPEEPLVKGIANFFQEKEKEDGYHIAVAGPNAAAAMLEGSKNHAKAFMLRHQIPTAAYQTFTRENINEGKAFLRTLHPPYVLKADGLAAGKGVLIHDALEPALQTLEDMLQDGRFGEAGSRVVVEEFLHGIEISVFAVSDGSNWQVLGSAKDYKRVGDGDTGLNTGGMGAVSPVPFANEAFMQKVRDLILAPTFQGLAAEGTPFRGFLFVGLMNCGGDPYVIEYNVRMGDPETEVVIPRLHTDLGNIVLAMCQGNLQQVHIEMKKETALGIVLASKGYPGDYPKGLPIDTGEDTVESYVYHAGTQISENQLVTSGGRVMVVQALGTDIADAADKAYQRIAHISFDGMQFRNDIGQDLLALQRNELL